MIDEADLQKIEEYLKLATPGPWYRWEYETLKMSEPTAIATIPSPDSGDFENEKIDPDDVEVLGSSEWLRVSKADLDFIVKARSDLPKLLKEIRRLSSLHKK